MKRIIFCEPKQVVLEDVDLMNQGNKIIAYEDSIGDHRILMKVDSSTYAFCGLHALLGGNTGSLEFSNRGKFQSVRNAMDDGREVILFKDRWEFLAHVLENKN